MKIFFTNIEAHDPVYFKKYFPEVVEAKAYTEDKLLTEANVSDVPNDTEILAISRFCTLNKGMIDQLPNLKLVAIRATGMNLVDLEYCKEKGIEVKNMSGYATEAVSEYSVAILLVLLRNLHTTQMMKEQNNFAPQSGFEINGKKVGVVGFGHIGRATAKIAAGFGAEILFTNRSMPEGVPDGFKRVETFEELLPMCDIIFFCCPLTGETKHLINMETIALLKKGCFLVNASRGGLFETSAILKGLEDGTIRGLALDVLEEEKEVWANPDHPLRKQILENPKVVFTPHNAFLSYESMDRLWQKVSEVVSKV